MSSEKRKVELQNMRTTLKPFLHRIKWSRNLEMPRVKWRWANSCVNQFKEVSVGRWDLHLHPLLSDAELNPSPSSKNPCPFELLALWLCYSWFLFPFLTLTAHYLTFKWRLRFLSLQKLLSSGHSGFVWLTIQLQLRSCQFSLHLRNICNRFFFKCICLTSIIQNLCGWGPSFCDF